MKLRLLALLLLVVSSSLGAQIVRYYGFAYSSETYTAIDGTAIANLQADDVMSEPVNIGFSFPYCGQNYSTLRISTNGWINPGSNWDTSNPSNHLNYGIDPAIAPLWDDLSMQGGNVKTLLSGEAPNRCFTIQYYHARWNYTGSTTWFDFQVCLFENGLIKFVYGSHLGNPASPSASIGINMAPAGAGNFYSISPGDPATTSNLTENNLVSSYPASGTVYSFIPVPPVQNDLSVTSITPIPYMNVHQSFSAFVTVKNNATQAINTYDVVLYEGTNELARMAGIELQPGGIHVFAIEAVIDSSGLKTITGKAELDSDEYPVDNSRSFNCIVRPDPTTGIIFGAGDELWRIPLDLYWKYSLYETLYYPAEIGTTGLIYGVSFYNDFVTNHLPTLKLWIGETSLADLSSGWIPASQLFQVMDMEISIPNGQSEVYLPFSTPYHYQGQNLVLMAYQSHTYYSSSNDRFQAQNMAGLRAMKRFTDTVDPDPYNPPSNIVANGEVPKIAFYLVTSADVEDETIPPAVFFANHPNPFSDKTSFSFAPTKAPTKIDIYNLKGQKIRSLIGTDISWDGCDGNGCKLPAGVYLARMKQGERVITRKLCKL